jgi:hypothetical protein
MDGADDLAAVYALQINARDTEVRVSELPLDHDKRDTFVRHLDRVRVPQLVGREPPSHACGPGRVMQLFARRRRFPTSSGSRSVNHAQHRADRQLAADLEPGIELVPRPTVHPYLSTLTALPTPDEYSTAGAVKVALLERERFVDPQSGTPKQHNQRSESVAVGAVTDSAHHSDDLFDRRRIGRVLLALISRWTASVIAGNGRG